VLYFSKNTQFRTFIYPEFNAYGSVRRKNIVIYIQQDATLNSLFYLETAVHFSRATCYLLPAASGR
jgi:hypothetical protein